MFFSVFIHHYLLWHYRDALRGYLRIYKNFFWFFVSFFSISDLCRSFFAPYKRITEPRGRGFNIEAFVSALIINTVSRCIGMAVRAVLIFSGFITVIVYSIFALLGYALWLGAPFVIITSIVYGIIIAM